MGELERLRACHALGRETDDALEAAIRDRLPLQRALAQLMPILCAHSGASGAWVRTFNEDLELSDHGWGEDLSGSAGHIVEATGTQRHFHQADGQGQLLAQHIDVAGSDFGQAAIRVPDRSRDPEELQALLETWCELVDNFLADIERSRRKQGLQEGLMRALAHPVLSQGVAIAVGLLQEQVRFEDLVLVFRGLSARRRNALNYRIVQGRELRHDSFTDELRAPSELEEKLRGMLDGGDRSWLGEFGIGALRENVLISGVAESHVVGRLLVANRTGEFNTYDRDMLENFAQILRQRIVDFNREQQLLSQFFSPAVVLRLMGQEGYRDRFLEAREQACAVMYADISGFTRLSEQELRNPDRIGALVNEWSAQVVDIIWQCGGVFDKMVGDCVIGLWGPPFFDRDGRNLCSGAVEAARRIRDYTARLHETSQLLRGVRMPVGVAVGLNYCPLFVGLFGPNDDYTGFSSGMNNTARLQGLAKCDEILCTEGFCETLAQPEHFGEPLQATVKNVAEPLRYRMLKD